MSVVNALPALYMSCYMAARRIRSRGGGFAVTDQAAAGVLAVRPRGRVLRATGRVVLVALLAAVPVATGAVGYYIGTQEGRSVAPETVQHPTWTDRELRPTGTQFVLTLRCSYHQADGTIRIRDSVVFSYQPATHVCP